jgi:SAM-dependent methyltransferase
MVAMSDSPLVFDRDLLVRRRERAAGQAASHDFLLAHAADDLVDRLRLVRRTFDVALVLGAHHGILGRRLRTLPSVKEVIETERSPTLAGMCDPPVAVADEEMLPFRPASVDLVVSALALQWVNDLPGTLAQVRAALRPDGLFIANLIGGRTLFELRQSFLEAESETTGGAGPRVAPFIDVRDAGALLQRADLRLPVADVETLTVGYATPLELMRELRGMGAGNSLLDRPRSFLRRATLLRAVEIYQSRFARPDGRITATFEIVTMLGWAPHASQQQPLAPGSARTSLADALSRKGED